MANTQSLHALLDQTGWIHALAQRLVADPHLAADLAQDTCVDALEREPDSARPLRGWLATVMRNKLAKLRRGEGNRSAREKTRAGGEPEPATLDVVEKAETHRNVVLAVLALEEPYRSTLLMRFFEQLSYDEIARRTGLTRAAVNSRVTRGLEELRRRLETTYGGNLRALVLALTPLAKLPTGVATTTTVGTFLGLKTMHIAIGTAAATLLAATVSVTVIGGGREPREPGGSALAATVPLQTSELELRIPTVLEEIEPTIQLPLQDAVVQREQKEKERQDDVDVWRTEVFQAQVLAPTVEAISVNSGAGDVEVLASPSGRLEVQAKVRAKLDRVKREQLTQAFEDHVTISEKKGVLTIEDAHNNERGWTVDFVVSVPGRLPLFANSGAGDVTVRTGSSRVKANSGAGDVRVALAQERLSALGANTGAGDVVVEVLSIEEQLEANSGAGDVSVLVVDASSPGSANLNSGAGDVHLVVPFNIVGSFDLETNGDGIVVPRGLGLVVREDGGHHSARGTVGSGGGKYRLRSGAGELKVELGNALTTKER